MSPATPTLCRKVEMVTRLSLSGGGRGNAAAVKGLGESDIHNYSHSLHLLDRG